MSDIVNELKEKIDIVELISQYITLKKRGSNYFGLCPFHSEKTPSFSVNTKGQFFHCFGCGESGDAITFFMKMENLEFSEAVKELAERYNVDLKFDKHEKKSPILDIHKEAEKYFHFKLKQHIAAVEYLKRRRIDESVIENFMIGYAPRSGELYVLLSKKYQENELIRSGIFVKTAKGIYNRFANRIVFPIKNEKGITIAFGGRVFNNEKNVAKYINSPETSIFSKQRILYGLFKAKEGIKKHDKIIITEGYFDCIKLHSIGIENTVATLGTALSSYHLNAIKRYTENLYFNYDADEAGFRAMARSAKTILSSELFSYVVSLNGGEDPDSYIERYGKNAYLKKIKEAKDYFDYLLEYLNKKYDTTKPQNKLKIIEDIKPILLSIKNTTMRSLYTSKSSKMLGISEDVFVHRENTKEFVFQSTNKEEIVLSLLLKDIELMSWIEDLDKFKNELGYPYKELYERLIQLYLSGESFDMASFEKLLVDERLKKLTYKLLALEYTEIDNRHERRKIFLNLLGRFEIENIKLRLKEIKKRLQKDSSEELLEEYNNLFKKLKESME